jgi:hypothetical protein
MGSLLNSDGDFDIYVEDPWFFRNATDEYTEPGKSVAYIRYSPLYDVAPIWQSYCFVLVYPGTYTPRVLPLAGYPENNVGEWLDNNSPNRRESKPVPTSRPHGGPRNTRLWNDPKWRMRGLTNKRKFCYPVHKQSVLYWEDEDRWFTEAEYYALLGKAESYRELCEFPTQRTLDRVEYLVVAPTLQGIKAPSEAPWEAPWRIDLASSQAPRRPLLGRWWEAPTLYTPDPRTPQRALHAARRVR